MARVIKHVNYPNYNFYSVLLDDTPIKVTVTATPSVVRKWLYFTLDLRRYYVFQRSLVVGLGVQWTPGGADCHPDTLQLNIGQRCLIFQLDRANYVPNKLRRFLLDPLHTFVGFWNKSDRKMLLHSRHRLEMARNPLDLRRYADGENGEILVQASVNKIVAECLGLEVDQRREISMSDWDREKLRDDQVVYATVDAHCAFLFGKNIGAWEFNR